MMIPNLWQKKKSVNVPSIITASEEDPFTDVADESDDEQNSGLDDEGDGSTAAVESNDSDGDSNVMPVKTDTENTSNKNASIEMEISPSLDVKSPKKAKTKSKKSLDTSATEAKKSQKPLSDDQIQSLIRGCSKKDRFVLYITNLNYSTTREQLTEFFAAAGLVKSVRVPKVRRSAFAFVEMSDIDGFKVCLILHRTHVSSQFIGTKI